VEREAEKLSFDATPSPSFLSSPPPPFDFGRREKANQQLIRTKNSSNEGGEWDASLLRYPLPLPFLPP